MVEEHDLDRERGERGGESEKGREGEGEGMWKRDCVCGTVCLGMEDRCVSLARQMAGPSSDANFPPLSPLLASTDFFLSLS